MPMKNCDSWCQAPEPVAYCWMGQETSHPLEGDIRTLKSLVIPALACGITCAQSTAARSAGVRATPAMKRALYECTNWMNCACVMLAVASLIQVAGRGKPSDVVATVCAVVVAESRFARAVAMT